MKRLLSVLVIATLVFTPVTAFAADSYMDTVGDKFQMGVKDTLLGWTKLFSVPYDYHVANKNPMAGMGKGLVDAIGVTIVGAVNLVTFPIPGSLTPPDGGVDLKG